MLNPQLGFGRAHRTHGAELHQISDAADVQLTGMASLRCCP